MPLWHEGRTKENFDSFKRDIQFIFWGEGDPLIILRFEDNIYLFRVSRKTKSMALD